MTTVSYVASRLTASHWAFDKSLPREETSPCCVERSERSVYWAGKWRTVRDDLTTVNIRRDEVKVSCFVMVGVKARRSF